MFAFFHIFPLVLTICRFLKFDGPQASARDTEDPFFYRISCQKSIFETKGVISIQHYKTTNFLLGACLLSSYGAPESPHAQQLSFVHSHLILWASPVALSDSSLQYFSTPNFPNAERKIILTFTLQGCIECLLRKQTTGRGPTRLLKQGLAKNK